jgi:hypothetical protein
MTAVNRSLYARLPEETRTKLCLLVESSRQPVILNASTDELARRIEKRAQRRKRRYDRQLVA